MGILYWALSQITSYSVVVWIGFIVLAFLVARFLGLPRVILGQILIAVAICALDFEWVHSEMRKPGWNGQPDQDFVFVAGVVFRIVLINSVLSPISFVAIRLKRRRKVAGV